MFILAISDICSDVFPFRFGVPLPAPPERIAATPVTVQSGDYLELPSKYAGKRLRFFFFFFVLPRTRLSPPVHGKINRCTLCVYNCEG